MPIRVRDRGRGLCCFLLKTNKKQIVGRFFSSLLD